MKISTVLKSTFGAILATVLLGINVQATPVNLDPFTTVQSFQQTQVGVVDGNSTATASVPGGWRTLQVEKTQPTSTLQASTLTVDDQLNLLTFNQDNLVRSKGLVTYDGAGVNAPATIPGDPVDQSIPAFDVWSPTYGLKIIGTSDNIGLPVTFSFYGAGSSTSATLDLRANGQGDAGYVNPYFVSSVGGGFSFFFIPLTSFSNVADNAAIFSAVTAFQIYFDGANAATSIAGTDASIARLSIGEVPEPGTYALLGAGLLAIGFARKRFV